MTPKNPKPVTCPWCGGAMDGEWFTTHERTRAGLAYYPDNATCSNCFADGPSPKSQVYATKDGAIRASLRACVRKGQK